MTKVPEVHSKMIFDSEISYKNIDFANENEELYLDKNIQKTTKEGA